MLHGDSLIRLVRLLSAAVLIAPGSRLLLAQTPDTAAAHPPACQQSLTLALSGVDDMSADYARLLELRGAAPLRWSAIRRVSSSPTRDFCLDGHAVPWSQNAMAFAPPPGRLRLVPVQVRAEENSAYAEDRNNGVLWAGRGLSAEATAGVSGRYRSLSAAVVPTVAWQQNRAFQIMPFDQPGLSAFAYSLQPGLIDWPQRFGNRSYATLHPGQSYLRVDVRGFGAGVSTENIWWGPARINPLLMSNTAPGFPHVFLGSSRPVDVGIGTFEGEAIWGRLRESKYFDNDTTNDDRLMAGLVLAFSPAPVRGLTIGLTRAYLETIPPGGLGLSHYFTDPYEHPTFNPLTGRGNNQLASLFFRWAVPEGGFEAYGEWAREDNWDGSRDLVLEPEHSQGYTIGVQSITPTRGRWLRLYAELTNLEASTSIRSGRGAVTFYTHGQIIQGYTENGQLLGAFIGPGSNFETIGGDLLYARGSTGLALERQAHDNDSYYAAWARYYAYTGHDVELAGALRQRLLLPDVAVDASLRLARRYNRDFLDLSPTFNIPRRIDYNLHAILQLTWRPRLP